ncbi:acyl carrier protein [Chitinophaga sp. Mgbs1]|uniref:Acyl carrier protein n=1 Tax=Chitinophaga solisilvae TaxID=1233460 RepID=A0A9Q5D7Z2_9BACT|nr:acyl carrier protein [Chitinophaga solisilvae]
MNEYTPEEIMEIIVKRISVKANLPVSAISVDENMVNYDLDSIETVGLIGEIETIMEFEFDVSKAWEYPTIRTLAHFIFEEFSAGKKNI